MTHHYLHRQTQKCYACLILYQVHLGFYDVGGLLKILHVVAGYFHDNYMVIETRVES